VLPRTFPQSFSQLKLCPGAEAVKLRRFAPMKDGKRTGDERAAAKLRAGM